VIRKTRPISWITAARKDFERFPLPAQSIYLAALTIAAEGGMADVAKPYKGLGSGIFEIALPWRGDAFRVVYAVKSRTNSGFYMLSKRSQGRESRRRSMRQS
jgi:phage-related protein